MNSLFRLGLVAAFCLGRGARAEHFSASTNAVGHFDAGIVTPANQIVTPVGQLLELPGMRPQALALSPDGKLLVTSGRTHELVVVNPETARIIQRVSLPSGRASEQPAVSAEILAPDSRAQLSFTGLAFSPDGSRIYLSNVNGDIKVFGVGSDQKVSPLYSIGLPPAGAPGRKAEIPAGIVVSRDGKRLYVALNLSNRLAELDAVTGRVLRMWDVGVAPYDVLLCRNKIYVSNWGGRRPDLNSPTGPAGRGMKVRVDARSIASEGSVSVIDAAQPVATNPRKEIVVGPHACGLALSPNRRWLVVASAGSDTLTVIDTRNDKVVEKISARQNPGDLFGAQPNALAVDWRGNRLFVCNGSQNAVAVFRFKPGKSELLGLIPVGWFPGGMSYDARRGRLYVANIKSLPRNMRTAGGGAVGRGYNTHQYTGSLSLVPVPSERVLVAYTRKALANLRYPLLAQANLPPRAGRKPVPVPERVGEPSVFNHVVYVIKENRTYDQVLGDVLEGNGDPDLCVFGRRVTPNQHKLAHDFVLLDNTYCSGILSADGHNWTDSGIATDYVEREFAGWPRSYPCGGDGSARDALAYSPAGFIWNDALEHGKTVADFGEYTTASKRWRDPRRKGKIGFLEAYTDFVNRSNAIVYSCEPDIEFLRPYLMTNSIGWDLDVPDVWRAAQFSESLKQFEVAGRLPNLLIVWLPNDHTSGTDANRPTPKAMVADNDLALGRIVEAVSHSKFWKDTCIFAIEDDPQNGWDHVSGYRTTAYVASAYTKRHAVIHTQYNQTSLLRTMELMLGLPPMNQMDATATPMFDCFTNIPDFTAFDSVPNEVPLDQMNPSPGTIKEAQLRKDAYASARLPLDKPDRCNEDVLNRIIWRATMGTTPYPEWAVRLVDDD